MLVLRSLLFNAAFYVNLVAWAIILLPTFVLPHRVIIGGAKAWARSSVFLLRIVAGTRLEVRGREHIPPGGVLVAAKHQSTFETFALLTLFDDPAFILKRELMWIPLFGWCLWRSGQVPVDRSGDAAELAAMRERVLSEVRRGRQIIIFPEGTRRPVGAPPSYKLGIVQLYRSLGAPCLPVALNAGLFWPRRRFIRRPGTIVIEILPPIPAGLPRRQMLTRLEAAIEEATAALVAEGTGEFFGAADEDARPAVSKA